MNIIVPKFDGLTMGRRNRLLREMSWGEHVKEYIEREKAEYKQRAAKIIGVQKYHQQNKRSDFQKDFVCDARTYMRWLKEDPWFWHDNNNVKRFKRDNPEVVPWK